jgi:hypothetical protein
MTARLALAALALAAFSLAATAADDHPYKNVKVGDYVTYKLTVKVGDFNLDGTTTQTVTAKSDKEVTVKVTAKVGGMDAPSQEQKIDLTKPYDPTKGANLPPGSDAKVEKLKEGKEKVKVGGKEYDCTWTTYKMTAKAMGVEFSGDIKVWAAKEVPMGTAKMEMTADIQGMKMTMNMELSESGNKK